MIHMTKALIASWVAALTWNAVPLYLYAMAADGEHWFDSPTVQAVTISSIIGVLLWIGGEWSRRMAERRTEKQRKAEQQAEIDAKTAAAAKASEDRMRVRIEDSSAAQSEQMRQTISRLSETIERLAEERDKMAEAADKARAAQMQAHETMWRALADVENLNREKTTQSAEIKTLQQTVSSLREVRDAQDRENEVLRTQLKEAVEAFTRQIQAEDDRKKVTRAFPDVGAKP